MQNTDQTGRPLKPSEQLNRILLRFPLDEAAPVLAGFKRLKEKQGVEIVRYVLDYSSKSRVPVVVGYDDKGKSYGVGIHERKRPVE